MAGALYRCLVVLTIARVAAGIAHCPNNCFYNGRCNIHSGQCSCLDGFFGHDCSGDCGCSGNGVCKNDHTCECHDGWTWSHDQQKCVMHCSCAHGEECLAPGVCGCQHQCKYGTCWNGQCECWAGYTGISCSHLDTLRMPNRNVSVGVNLGGVTYYSSEFKFVDIAKQSQSWVTERVEGTHAKEWDTHEQDSVTWRDDGYPASLDGTMVIGKLMYRTNTPHPAGNYTILYDGEGEVDLRLVHFNRYYDGKGKMVVNMHPGNGGIMLVIKRTNPANPIRNIRILQPGFHSRYKQFPFNPIFLESLTRYSEFRFMDFMHTNNHQPEPTIWSTRRKMDYHTQAGQEGVAIEYMVLLCNIMGANAWFNIPHAADDDYVTNMAQLIKQTLRPDLKVYFEYSNEVWNGIFRQFRYVQEEGRKRNLDSQGYRAGMKYHNMRSTQVMDIVKQVFGSNTARIIPVWAWQTGYQDWYRQALDDLGNRTSHFKALAVTGYFSCDQATTKHKQEFANMTMEQISDLCKLGLVKSVESYQHYMQLAKAHGLKLVMYEGGPSVMEPGAISHGTSNGPVTDKAIAYNRDTHMEQSSTDILNGWKQNVDDDAANTEPGGLFNYFSSCGTPSKYGSWGMIEYTGQNLSSVPKYLAVQKFITKISGHDVLGPKCSFIQIGDNEAYGCFKPKTGQQQNQWKCGRTLNNGHAWLYLTDIHKDGGILVLDGYNPVTHTLFVRSINSVAASDYITVDTHSNQWNRQTSWDYHMMLASSDVIRRLPEGVTHNLDINSDCLYRRHVSLPVVG